MQPRPGRKRLAIFWTILLALAFGHALLAGAASSSKSPTFDEPVHALGSILNWQFADYRVNPEHPALWHHLLAVGFARERVVLDFSQPSFLICPVNLDFQWNWMWQNFCDVPSNRALELIQSMRWRSAVLFGSPLVILTALLCRRLLAGIAWADPLALAAAALVAFDANFLAHSALVTNDVPITMAFVMLLLGVLQMGGRQARVGAIGLTALAASLCVTFKFTGIVLLGAVAAALLLRAVVGGPWTILGRTPESRGGRFFAAIGLLACIAVACWISIWASYGFRFAALNLALNPPVPTPATASTVPPAELTQLQQLAALGPDVFERFDFQSMLVMDRSHRFMWQFYRAPDLNSPFDRAVLADSAGDGLVLRGIMAAREAKLLPESYLYGFLYAYVRGQFRGGYLLGDFYVQGRFYYFPLAMLFKTPLATLFLLLGAAVIGAGALWRRRWRLPEHLVWPVLLLALPAMLYLLTAMLGALNLGIRHVLVLYPPLIALAMLTLATCRGREASEPGSPPSGTRRGWPVGLVLCGAVLTAAESVAVTPDFLSFFNLPSTAVGKLKLLGDSNIDWGQDLTTLAQWQKRNPDRKLYLCYFGTMDPKMFGLQFKPWPAESGFARPAAPEYADGGVLALSATHWQSIYAPAFRNAFISGRPQPFERVGESIYLFEVPPAAATSPATQP